MGWWPLPPMQRGTGTARSSHGNSGKMPRGGSADAAQRSHQLGLSEQVVLKAKLLTQDLENDETVMQQGTKKLENVLSSLAARMSDKVCYDDFYILRQNIWSTPLISLRGCTTLGAHIYIFEKRLPF